MNLKRPVWALYVLIVGLALHNVVVALLWRAGVRGTALTLVSAWKDVLLIVAVVLVVRGRRGLPFKATATDWLALAFGVLVVLYGVLPQSWLGGGATHKPHALLDALYRAHRERENNHALRGAYTDQFIREKHSHRGGPNRVPDSRNRSNAGAPQD